MSFRRAPLERAVLALALGSLLLGCSKSTKPKVLAPNFTGRIRLVADQKDEVGTRTGTIRVEDANGARVHLRRPDGTLDSTLSVNGRYEFHLTETGRYRAFVRVLPEHAESTSVVEFTGADLMAADTLVLAPSGLVTNYPNPLSHPHGVGIEFTLGTAQHVDITVKNLSGKVYFTYSYDPPAGFQHIHWLGDDGAQHEAPAGAYWTVVRAGTDAWYGVVFKQ